MKMLLLNNSMEGVMGKETAWPLPQVKITAEAGADRIFLAEEFGGEYERRSHAYILLLWLVSIWAMITNLAQGFSIKLFKQPKDLFRKILWEMGRDPNHISSSFVDRFSRFNHRAKYGAAGWPALDLFYNYYEKIKSQLSGMEGFFTRLWIERMENRQAVANRVKIVANLLAEAFAYFKDEPEIRLVSLASGSAQAVVEAIRKSLHLNLNIMVHLIDSDESALAEAKKLAESFGLSDKFTFVHGPTSLLKRVCTNFQPHIVEMVGFLDYRPEEKAINLIKKIYNHLAPGGVFITCNIKWNREKIFLDWVLLWPMIYRSIDQLRNVVSEGGFRGAQIITDKFGIHNIAFARK